jgi:hypothetical protein
MIAYCKGGKMVSEYKRRADELDDFWDISSLVPTKRRIRTSSKSIDTVEITHGNDVNTTKADNKLTIEDTVIKRFIPPNSPEADMSLLKAESYRPSNPLLHKVTLYKVQNTYDFYADFVKQARALWERSGVECEYAEFFSYSPQYDQLSAAQLEYYLWWRSNVRNGRFIKTNTCYINLYMYELINTSGIISPEEARERMIETVKNYSDVLKGAVSRYVKWICDFSLIHRLDPPNNNSKMLLVNAATLKEYFVRVPENDTLGWARALLEYCCSYDYKTSKFAKDEALELFDTHVPKAIAVAVEYLSKEGRILSRLPFGDCKITAKAFEGALCTPENRYSIEVEYCSFSRSHELRFLIGDIVKYCENKIRAYIFVKSRLTVYSLPIEISKLIDEYFQSSLPQRKRPKEEKHAPEAYDVLYDLPRKQLDLSNAARIENESWETTKELVETFSEECDNEPEKVDVAVLMEAQNNGEKTLPSALGEYADCVKCLADNDSSQLLEKASALSKPIDAIVDIINEIAVDVIGDILIDGDDGDYYVIDDYRSMLE